MTSRMPTHPSASGLGSDPELSLNSALGPALGEDERTKLFTHLRRNSDVFVCQVVDDATPEAIADEEPTVPIIMRTIRAVHSRPSR